MTSQILTCPDNGRWRAWLDAEAEDATALEAHLTACAACDFAVADLREQAGFAATMVGGLPRGGVVSIRAAAEARERFARRGAAAAVITAAPPPPAAPASWRTFAGRFSRRSGRSPWFVGGLAAALLIGVMLALPSGRTAVAQLVGGFRGEKIAVVQLSTEQIQNIGETFSQLEQFGTVTGLSAAGEPREVDSAAEAGRIAGFTVRLPDTAKLPAGVERTPEIYVMPASEVRFTFDRQKALAYYRSTGRPAPDMPQRFDGATIVAKVPAVVGIAYSGTTQSSFGFAVPFVVAQGGLLSIDVEGGMTIAELRDFLLRLPGLSPDTARVLRQIENWQTTLPLPVPAGMVEWQPATIAGVDGLAFVAPLNLGSAAIWIKDGSMYGAGGGVTLDQIRQVAGTLR